MTATAKADLHVHSKHSDQPSAWLLQHLDVPESFTEPLDVYQTCRRRGMDFVTITDHDTIAGALEIAHLPGTFLSSEVTVSFPEDGCQVHCLVLDVSEQQFAEIDRRRGDLYAFRDYLFDEGILHSLAHPLFRVNDQLTLDHWEKLIVLFKRFEAINGAREAQAGVFAQAILENLTSAFVAKLADKHGLDPRDEFASVKYLTGGSDDHSGLYIGNAYTQTPPTFELTEFLAYLREGRHRPGGTAGNSLKLARCFYHIAYQYYRQRLATGSKRGDLFGELLEKILVGADRPPAGAERLRSSAAKWFVLGRAKLRDSELSLTEEVVRRVASVNTSSARPAEQRSFELAGQLSQEIAAASLGRALREARHGRLGEAFKALNTLVPTALAVAPYLASFHTQHKDRGFLAEVARNFPAARGTTKPRRKKLWFTDTLTEVNGVARSTCAVAEVARRRGAALTVVSCSEAPPPSDLPVAHFQPTAAFDLPEYPELRLPVPPMLEMLAYCEREMPSEIIISTPGPVGLIGLVAAELFGIPAVGIYHTDFPAYVRHLTASPMLEGVAWAYMRWFFGRMERLFVRSQASADDLVRGGFEAASMQVLPAGVDARLFHPERRQNDFWRLRGLQGETTLLYVGRVSKEKNLDLLLTAFEQLSAEQPEVTLAIVGDGPQLAELRARVDHPRVLLTGYLEGDQLATAYASSDLFVFPSATDTFGNAILEAHASGLPAVVANQGGPPEIVEASGAGATFDPADPCDLLAALRPLLQDPAHRHALGHRAREYARGAGWEQVFEQLWHTPGDPTPARTLHPMEEWWADLARVGA